MSDIIRLEGGGELNLGEISVKLEGEYIVGFNAPYAAAIEFGTVPHYPGEDGIEALEGWASRKLGLSWKESKKAAQAIAWKIFRHGTDPQPYFRPAIDETRAQLGDLLKRGFTIEEIANIVRQRAEDNIERKGISDEGGLIGSGFVREIQ